MNGMQVLRQIRYLLEKMTWSGSPNEKIFSDVVISDVPARDLIGHLRHPFAVVHSPQTSPRNDEIIGYLNARFDVEIYMEQNNDRFGEAILIGGSHATGAGSSKGKGVLQIEEEIRNLSYNARTSGIEKLAMIKGARGESVINDNKSRTIRIFSFEAVIQRSAYFHPVYNLTGQKSGSDVILNWVDPPDRFDRLNIVIVRKTNSAPTGPTDGTVLGTVAFGVQTYTDTSPPAGSQYYGLFVAYDSGYSSSPASATDYSSGESVEVVV